jgi:hypothetical protein
MTRETHPNNFSEFSRQNIITQASDVETEGKFKSFMRPTWQRTGVGVTELFKLASIHWKQ